MSVTGEKKPSPMASIGPRLASASGAVRTSAPARWVVGTGWPRTLDGLRAAWRVIGPVLTTVSGFGWAVLGALVLAILSAIIGSILRPLAGRDKD
jgi:hypothetical protein